MASLTERELIHHLKRLVNYHPQLPEIGFGVTAPPCEYVSIPKEEYDRYKKARKMLENYTLPGY